MRDERAKDVSLSPELTVCEGVSVFRAQPGSVHDRGTAWRGLQTLSKQVQCNHFLPLPWRGPGQSESQSGTPYTVYIRSKADCGAAIYMTHTAPSSRNMIEVEQRACTRIITGRTRATRIGALEAEAGLQSLSVIAKILVSREYQRIRRLPEDPTRRYLKTR